MFRRQPPQTESEPTPTVSAPVPQTETGKPQLYDVRPDEIVLVSSQRIVVSCPSRKDRWFKWTVGLPTDTPTIFGNADARYIESQPGNAACITRSDATRAALPVPIQDNKKAMQDFLYGPAAYRGPDAETIAHRYDLATSPAETVVSMVRRGVPEKEAVAQVKASYEQAVREKRARHEPWRALA